MPYTIEDTPAIVDRIEADLATIAATVRDGDPHLRALVLTGAFSRGEGAVLDGQPQNDYDLVALRGVGRADPSYPEMAAELEDELGLHIDLAPVPTWRLRWVDRSIFWYETALRGQTLWGPELLDRIPIRSADDLAPTEGLRLLVNRAAGLLLATGQDDPHHHRIQASKALLAAADAHLLPTGNFPPSQTERWRLLRDMHDQGSAPSGLDEQMPWFAWAYSFKVDPKGAGRPAPEEAWQAARQAVLEAVPRVMAHAELPSLDAYQATDGLADHLVYAWKATQLSGATPLAANPTGKVRVATLRLLQACPDGTIRPEVARRHLGALTDIDGDPLDALDALRQATLQ